MQNNRPNERFQEILNTSKSNWWKEHEKGRYWLEENNRLKILNLHPKENPIWLYQIGHPNPDLNPRIFPDYTIASFIVSYLAGINQY